MGKRVKRPSQFSGARVVRPHIPWSLRQRFARFSRKDHQIFVDDRGVAKCAGVTGGAAAEIFPHIDTPAGPEAWNRFARLDIERVQVILSRRENPPIVTSPPIRKAPVVSPAWRAGIELPDLLAGGRVHSKHPLAGRVPVHDAVDNEGVRLQAPGPIARVIAPSHLQLIDIGRVDLFQCRIPRVPWVSAIHGPIHFPRRFLRIDQGHREDEISRRQCSNFPVLHMGLSRAVTGRY